MRAILCHDSNQSVKMASGKQINPVISPNLNNPDSSKLVFNQDFDIGVGDWLTDVQVQDIDVASALQWIVLHCKFVPMQCFACVASSSIYELTRQGWNFRSSSCGTWKDGEDQKTPKNSGAIHRQTVQSPGHLNQHLK